ncbi:hypothetical protein ACTVZO_43185 [Streptomyces sp. IBSNAI002]|uniref:hypothetical protein n=1 Tax=Streptomyces sp. IBSNAI002 TaxID=3457500 RepID=UPI003FD11906
MDTWVKKHLKSMAKHYIEVHRADALAELEEYSKVKPFAQRAALVGAGLMPDGIRLHDHQLPIPNKGRKYPDALPDCSDRLRDWAWKLETATSFAESYRLIERAKEASPRIVGIGDLSVYDFTQRLGFGLEPRLVPEEVYLHAGTAEGAVHLAKIMNRLPWTDRIPMDELPKVLRKRLDAADTEDVLCHFKNGLKQLADGREPDYSKVNCGCPGGPSL